MQQQTAYCFSNGVTPKIRIKNFPSFVSRNYLVFTQSGFTTGSDVTDKHINNQIVLEVNVARRVTVVQLNLHPVN